MIKTVEGMVDADGNVKLFEPVRADVRRRALVIILDEPPRPPVSDTALLSEPALAGDWTRPAEDAAWAHFQRRR